ncbi:hypothetical protein V6N13_099368 [Hibiscus sabdariffa]
MSVAFVMIGRKPCFMCSVIVAWRNRTQNVIADRVVALCCGSSVVSMTFDSVPVALTELVHKEVAAG